jgi:hypothetical protein
MLPVFTNLAERVNRLWSECGYDHEKFPFLAAESLEHAELPAFTTLARALSAGLSLPRQRRLDQSFGQPALTLYHDDRFVIEALCWHTGSPSIHQHSFSGAFRIATGQSAHSRYRFTEKDRVDGAIAVGTLELVDVHVLDQNSVTCIQSGNDLVHSAFHLDNPSMTVIVRTHDYPDPEYTYLPPGIAFDPSARNETLHKRLQLLDTLYSVGHPSYAECVALALGSSGIYEGMEVLIRVQNHGLEESLRLEFMARYLERHGPVVEPVIRAVEEQRRRMQLISLRRSVTDGDGRYFLACLLNSFDHASFRKQVAVRTADDQGAYAAVATGLRSMFGMGTEAEPLLLLAGRAMLEAVATAEFPAWLASINGHLGAEDTNLLEQIYLKLNAHPLFRPVLGA